MLLNIIKYLLGRLSAQPTLHKSVDLFENDEKPYGKPLGHRS